MTDDLDDVRAKLTARRDACFDRIDDAISELIAVHLVEPGEIRARVEASILHEQQLTDE